MRLHYCRQSHDCYTLWDHFFHEQRSSLPNCQKILHIYLLFAAHRTLANASLSQRSHSPRKRRMPLYCASYQYGRGLETPSHMTNYMTTAMAASLPYSRRPSICCTDCIGEESETGAVKLLEKGHTNRFQVIAFENLFPSRILKSQYPLP